MVAFLLTCGRPAPRLPVVRTDGYSAIVRKQISDAVEAAAKPDAKGEAAGRLGMILQAYRMERDALTCYESARILNPSDYRWWHLSAFLQSKKKNTNDAIAVYREALRLQPANDSTKLLLAELLIGSGQMPEARKLLQDLLDSSGRIARARLRLGQIHAMEGNYAAAIEEYQKALQNVPRYGEAYFALAEAYRKMGDPDRSKQQLAYFRRWEGSAPAAPDPLLAAVETMNISPTGLSRHGAGLAADGRFRLAKSELDKALESDPNLLSAHIHLIRVEEELGNPAKADEHYKKAVLLDPNSARAYAVYAFLLNRRGKPSKAIPLFEKALSLEPENLAAQVSLSEILTGLGKTEEAESHLRTALSRDSEDQWAVRALGVLLAAKNRCKEAIPLLEKVKELEGPAGVEGLMALSSCLKKTGDQEQSVAILRIARVRVDFGGTEQQLKSIERDLSLVSLGKIR